MLSISTPRKRFLEEEGLDRISAINISRPRNADAESVSTPPKKSRAANSSPAQIERPSFFPLGLQCSRSFKFVLLIDFSVDVSSLACEASDMPALYRKTARMRLESIGTSASSPAPSSSAQSSSTPSSSGDAAQEKLYTNSDVSKMIKEAVSSAVCQTKDKYQEDFAGKARRSVRFLARPSIFSIILTTSFFRTIPAIPCDSTKTISVAP